LLLHRTAEGGMSMEAIEFLKEYIRMCTMHKSCRGCPLEMDNCAGYGDELSEKQIINIIDKTEQWSKEHPLVTNEMKVREVFGDNAVNSILALHPSDLKRWLAEPYKERES
jgi:hypothetical protein